MFRTANFVDPRGGATSFPAVMESPKASQVLSIAIVVAFVCAGLLMAGGSAAVTILYALEPARDRNALYALVYFKIFLIPLGLLCLVTALLIQARRGVAPILARVAAVLTAVTIPFTVADSFFSLTNLGAFALLTVTIVVFSRPSVHALFQKETVPRPDTRRPFVVTIAGLMWILAGAALLALAVSFEFSVWDSSAGTLGGAAAFVLIAALVFPVSLGALLTGLLVLLFKTAGRVGALVSGTALLASIPFLAVFPPGAAAALAIGTATWALLFSRPARRYYAA